MTTASLPVEEGKGGGDFKGDDGRRQHLQGRIITRSLGCYYNSKSEARYTIQPTVSVISPCSTNKKERLA